MAQKYTILKVIIQNFSRTNKNSKGFTLIELIVGLSIMLIVGGLAMNALIQASTSFNKDKRSIDSSQNMSTILEMIGNDIKQSGENINEANFPAVEFNIATEAGLKSGSSKVIIRRALLSPLTLCEDILVTKSFTAGTTITVADNLKAVAGKEPNCDVGTSSSPLSVYRVPTMVTDPAPPTTVTITPSPTITTYYPQAAGIFNPYPNTPAPLLLKFPLALRKVRDYRCNTNPNTAYDSAANAGTDFCGPTATSTEKLRIAISNGRGQILVFNQTDEVTAATSDEVVNTDAATTAASTKKYQITIGKSSPAIPFAPADAVLKNNYHITIPIPTTPPAPASTIAYPIGSPIYVIEERVYTLTSDNKLQLSIDGKAAETLVKKIDNFRVSAKTYTDSKNRIIQETPAADVCTDAAPFAAQPTGTDVRADNPKYICKFNYFGTTTGTAGTADWKTLAGIKVEIQTKYDSTGQGSEHPTNPLLDSAQVKESKKKLYAASEFFPRNVLSK